ncbi:MAG: hypothetical protein EWV82_08070 [Microcystis aeruginosa Ma_AC_P_19900807_S299]|jgi:hypothetical protein|uniref:Uncharacterized protein n=1 Tax=Microcystis aeruginosa Ma_SC_T_19800800_S464 TaxID=2486257 RepID=A0A552E394_MICAE|nr:MAG: hypothetical protein EWV82_08070 [Microcystis aeruginosa Ma_AC_P_19900807_S299]TRU28938.1 MAG: hypothetical protein EWV81_03765 [Microcystis aeruginosa Ma_SC_T_19800800_S464]
MGIDSRTIEISRHINLEELETIAAKLSDWLLEEHGFALHHKQWEDKDHYVLEVQKTGFFRQLSGLVFAYKIKFSKADNSLLVLVDNGDIRNQLVSLGVAWFIAWPMLLTAGWGMYAKGEFRQTIFSQIEKIAHT